jgi:hypothetical protein
MHRWTCPLGHQLCISLALWHLIWETSLMTKCLKTGMHLCGRPVMFPWCLEGFNTMYYGGITWVSLSLEFITYRKFLTCFLCSVYPMQRSLPTVLHLGWKCAHTALICHFLRNQLCVCSSEQAIFHLVQWQPQLCQHSSWGGGANALFLAALAVEVPPMPGLQACSLICHDEECPPLITHIIDRFWRKSTSTIKSYQLK